MVYIYINQYTFAGPPWIKTNLKPRKLAFNQSVLFYIVLSFLGNTGKD